MTFKELLIACGAGEMPMVEASETPKNAKSNIGQVLNIKFRDPYTGCGVLFPGLNYLVWFNADDGTDKRSRYMRKLTLLPKDGVAKLEARIKELEEENQKLNIELDHCINQSGG